VQLPGPKSKLLWAFKQLKTLDDECRGIQEEEPFSVSGDFDADDRCHVMRFRAREDAFPSHLSLRVGDVVNNGRSALDQAMWAVACRSNDIEWLWEPKIARQIAFPPVWSKEHLPGHSVMSFITDDAKTVLKALQEHEGGDLAQALGALDHLWNIDKHRVIHRGVARLDVSEVRYRYGSLYPNDLLNGSPELIPSSINGPLKDGTEVARIRFRSGLGPPHTEVHVIGKPTALIAFGGGTDAYPVSEIAQLLIHVDSALSMIEGLSDEAPLSRASTEKG
jgi:hypothetical protein